MLDEWALRQSRWKKRLSSALYEKRHLRGAACLHALTDEEAGAIRRFGIDAPICVVPNGVTLRSSETGLPVPWNGLLDEEWNIVLSLGRLHWKKGLTNLIEGFYLAQQRTSHAKNWAVVIVGPDENGYRDVLQKQIEAMDLGKRVVIVAPQYGPLAEACFERAKAFILPSYSEGLPMVILEAWAHRLPVLMTRECNLPVGFNRGAAIEVLPTAESVAEGLMNLFSTTDADRTQMGTRGRTLIEERFTWEQVTKSFTEIYSWVSNGGSPPSSVVMN